MTEIGQLADSLENEFSGALEQGNISTFVKCAKVIGSYKSGGDIFLELLERYLEKKHQDDRPAGIAELRPLFSQALGHSKFPKELKIYLAASD